MIDDERPVVNADRHLGHFFRVFRACGQALETARKIVREITDRTAAEWQIALRGGIDREMLPQQCERILARQLDCFAAHFGQLAARDERHIRLGGNDVVARLRQVVTAAIEKYRPRQIGDSFEQRRAVLAIRQFNA